MTRVAVLLAEGFEQIEALTPVDLLRRAEIEVETVGMSSQITSSHQVTVIPDKIIDDSLSDYDLIVVPGGIPGAYNLRGDSRVIQGLQEAHEKGRKFAAICAGPIVLAEAGILDGKKFVCAPGFADQVSKGHHQDDAVLVMDEPVLTGRAAGISFEFALKLVEWCGGDYEKIIEDTQYNKLRNYHQD